MNGFHSAQENPYLALAASEPGTSELDAAVNILREHREPDILTHWSLANALVEAGIHRENQDRASSMLNEARSRLRLVRASEVSDDTSSHVQLSAAVFETFMPLYRQVIVVEDEPESPAPHLQHDLLSGLHDLATPRRIKANSYPNGGPAWEEWDEVAVHMLMARLSLRQGSTAVFTWPSFARYHSNVTPDPNNPNNIRHDWNLGIGFGFLSEDFRKINTRHNRKAELAESIQPLSLADVGLKSAKSIVTKLREEQTEERQLRKADRTRLKAFHNMRNKITQQTFYILADLGLAAEYDSFS